VSSATEPHPPPPGEGPRRRWWRRGGGESAERGHRRHHPASEADVQERLIVSALAALRDMDVREVMTPRVDVVALTIPVHAEDVAQAVRESGHGTFPVIHDDLDHLVGVLYVNDLFRTGRRTNGESLADPSPLDISRRLRQPLLIPESQKVLGALAEMRRHHRGFAVVVDEYGGVAGVLTIKDLLEPLVGDLHDEFDQDFEPSVVRVDTSRWLLDGRANVDEVGERLGIEIPDGEYVTLGGFLFDAFGHIPEEGEQIEVGDWQLRVVEMDKRRVAKVVARLRGAAPVEASERVEAPGPVPAANGSAGGGGADKPARVGAPDGEPAPLE